MKYPLFLHCVTSSFDPTTAFSCSSFQLAAHAEDRRSCRLGVTVNDLFEVDLKPEHAEALTFIMHSRRHTWPPFSSNAKKSEQVVMEISSHILLPLSRANEVVLEHQYSRISKPDGLRCGYLRMGSVHTWHGTPDIRVRGAEVVCRCADANEGDEIDAPDIDSDEESIASDGATTNIEGKIVYFANRNRKFAPGGYNKCCILLYRK